MAIAAPAVRRAQKPARRSPTVRLRGNSGRADEGAGILLALFVWAGVVLPYLKDGPTGVKNWMRAKFLNKGPDGRWLP